MLDFDFIKEKFITNHEKIDSQYYLNKYINFLLDYGVITEDNIYVEKHHILPVSSFPDFKNEQWNIVKLKYDDHKLVHLWLFKSINIRKYQRPLNWMVSYYKNSEEISNAAKRGWDKLKRNKKKYNDFCRKRSIYMKKLSSEEQKRRIDKFWNNISDEKYINFCNKMKSYWTDEKKKLKSKEMNKYYSNPDNINKKSIETLEHWNSMNKDKRKKFKDKMTIINKDKDKRKKSGEKIKELWNNDDYLDKMKNRKHKPGIKLKLIKPNGYEIIYKNMKDMTIKTNFSPFLIRKYRDTGIKIKKESLNDDNIFLLDCILESIKNKE